MSREFSDDDIRQIMLLMSEERLSYFASITTDDKETIALHQKAMQVSAALMPVVGLIEIAIRNAACDVLKGDFGKDDWLLAPPSPFQWKGDEDTKIRQAVSSAKRAAYTKLSNADKNALDAKAFPKGVPGNISHDKHTKKRQSVIDVSIGQIVAQLTLFFWKRLFSVDYEPTLWKPSLKRLFPNKRLDRSQVAGHLEKLYVARNRIAHHEPLYGPRLRDTLAAITFVSENLLSRRPSADTALAKLLSEHMPAAVTHSRDLGDLLRRGAPLPAAALAAATPASPKPTGA